MRHALSAAVLFAAAAAGALAAAPVPASSTQVPPAAAAASPAYQPVEFERIVMDLPAGYEWRVMEHGSACVPYGDATAAGGPETVEGVPELLKLFDRELANAGLKSGAAGDLFDPVAEPADLRISAVITRFREEICYPWVYPPKQLYQRGALSMVVEWDLYSRSQNRVLAKVATAVTQKVDARPDGAALLVHNAFAEAMRQMAADPALRQALRADVAAEPAPILPAAQPAITLPGSLAAQPRGLSSAVDSVVLVIVPGGHGSGFLVSKDGYLLTDAHVLGDNKIAKVRWSDGVEGEAQLVRLDQGRDVALLRTDPRGHAPLPLRRELPAVGETVFAIGAPLDRQLQGTVMRGIVSAHRVRDGYELIQSDVNANMGMSGGPLLDDQGRVVALTESKRLADDSRSKELNLSINFFTPVDDALKYLSATPQ